MVQERPEKRVVAQDAVEGFERSGCREQKRRGKVGLAQGKPEVPIEALGLRYLDRIDQVGAGLLQKGLRIAGIPGQQRCVGRCEEPACLSLRVRSEAGGPNEKRRLGDVAATGTGMSGGLF